MPKRHITIYNEVFTLIVMYKIPTKVKAESGFSLTSKCWSV